MALTVARVASARSLGAVYGLNGLSLSVQRGLFVAFGTSVAVVMGTQLVYPVLPPLMNQLGVSESAIGLVIALYTLPAVALAPAIGVLVDLWGRRPLLVGGLTLFGLAGAAVAWAPSFEWVLALRIVQGVGAAAISPLTILLLTDLVDDEQQERGAQGLKVVIDRLSTIGLPVVAGALAVLSWSWPFLLFGLTVPLAVVALWWLPETRGAERDSLGGYITGLIKAAWQPRLVLAYFAGFLRFFLDYAYFTYVPVYLVLARGSSPVTVGVIFGCFAVGAIITASSVSTLARGRDVAGLVFVGFALDGLALLAVPILPNDILIGASMIVYGLGNGLISPLQKSLLTRNAPPRLLGGVISLDRLIQQVAKSIAPGFVGVLLLFADLSAIFWVLGGCALASILVAGLLVRRGGSPRGAPA